MAPDGLAAVLASPIAVPITGRPPIGADLRALIVRMWRDSLIWGEDRVAGELAKIVCRVSPRTVAKYRPSGL